MLEMQGDTYVIGGQSNSGSESSIYQLSCSSGLCSWTILNQQLMVGRRYLVAIPVQDNFCLSEATRCSATNWDYGCCTPDDPCTLNQGDCDSDDECYGDLKCGTDNCVGFNDSGTYRLKL